MTRVNPTFLYFQRSEEVGKMSDTQEDAQKAAFLRFLSIIKQVIRDKVNESKFDFRQCATLKNLMV